MVENYSLGQKRGLVGVWGLEGAFGGKSNT
jgi:hypothetical protein